MQRMGNRLLSHSDILVHKRVEIFLFLLFADVYMHLHTFYFETSTFGELTLIAKKVLARSCQKLSFFHKESKALNHKALSTLSGYPALLASFSYITLLF